MLAARVRSQIQIKANLPRDRPSTHAAADLQKRSSIQEHIITPARLIYNTTIKTMVKKVDTRQKLLRHKLGHLVGQGDKVGVDGAKGEFCEVVHQIIKSHGSKGSVHDRLMSVVAGAMDGDAAEEGQPPARSCCMYT